MKNGLRWALAVAASLLAAGIAPANAFERVVTATTVIYPGQTIAIDQLKTVDLNRPMEGADRAVGDVGQIAGAVATKTILPNRLIFPDAFQAPPLVKNGQIVTVIYESGGVSISMRAIALEDGPEGKIVQARNRESGRILHARVMANGELALAQ